MSWMGGYELHLYCDKVGPNQPGDATDGVHVWNEFPHVYTDESGATCRAMARKAGWIIKSDRTAICPRCSGRFGSATPATEGAK